MPKPELLVYLYSDVARLQQNIHKRGRSYEQEISDAYLENIQQGYFDFLRQQQNNMRILLLDTNRLDFVANEKDYQRIIDAIDQPYEIGLHRISLWFVFRKGHKKSRSMSGFFDFSERDYFFCTFTLMVLVTTSL